MSDIEIVIEAGLRIAVMEPTAHREGRKHGLPTTLIQMHDSVPDVEDVPQTSWVSVYMDDNKLLLSTIHANEAGVEKDHSVIIRPEDHKWSFAALGKAIAD